MDQAPGDRDLSATVTARASELSASITVPDAVIGRDEVLARLEGSLASLPECGRRFVLLEGASGLGKSTMLAEMRRRVLATGGLAAAGEFGPTTHRRPSSGLRAAVGDIVATMLGLPDDEVQEWSLSLRRALGGPLEQFGDLIPEFSALSGRGAEPPGVSPTGLRNRLRLAVLALVRATARPTRPLVITLDDFDRADGESMQIVHDVVTADAEGLLVVATSQPGALAGQPVFDDPAAECVRLAELDTEGLQAFVGAALGSRGDGVCELAGVIGERVGGNPLAVLQFLQRAVAVGALTRPDPRADWVWSEATVRALDPAPSEERIAASLLREVEGADILETAACLGEPFTITELARASGRSSDAVAESILQALDARILRRLAVGENDTAFLDARVVYAFVHERVAGAVRAQVSSEQQAQVHRRLGHALLQSDEPDDVITAARHLNAARLHVGSAEESMELAALNARAARHARQTAAFPLALQLAESGLGCLPADADHRDHGLVLDLYLLAAEAACITGDLASMQSLIGAARSLQTTVLDRAELAYLEMKGLAAAENPGEAVSAGRAALSELGVRFPAAPRPRHVLPELIGVRRRLRGRSDEQLLALPKATDPESLAVQKLLAEMIGSAYRADPSLWALLVLRCLRVTLDDGRAPPCSLAFAAYGLLLGVMGRYESARRFGDLALSMAEHPDCREFRPWTKFFFYNFIHHWTRPTADAIEPVREAIREALLLGDLENAGFMSAVELYQSVSYGVSLPEIDARGAELAVYLRPYGAQFGLAECTRQLVHNLMGRSADPLLLVGETGYDEQLAFPSAIEHGDVAALAAYHLTKLGLHFLYGDFEGGVHHAGEAEKYLDGIRGTPNVPIFHLANSIVRLRSANHQRATQLAIRRARRAFRVWRKHSPENYEPPWLLIDAEIARASRRFRRAEDLYDKAISAADRTGQITLSALAREYCGDLHTRQGRDRVASAYLNSALEAWASFGADGKVEWLRRHYRNLLPATTKGTQPEKGSLLEVVNVIVEEAGVDDLLERVLATIVGLTGADRGVLFVGDGRMFAPAVVFEHGNLFPAPASSGVAYAASVVRYVERSDRALLIADTDMSVHGRDQHLHASGVHSVLCVAFRRGGSTRAVVYLECNEIGAFTPSHLEALQTLSIHVATALENAELNDRLNEAVRLQTDLVFAQSRFVPEQLLRELGRETLVATDAGDAVAREMTLLYSDIRGYTYIQEGLDPRHGIGFLNDYLRRMEPAVVAHQGFVVSYVGDGMVALFEASDDALKAALAMRRVEREVSEERRARGLEPIRTGIAVHTDKVVIGTFGGVNQLRLGVVGDAVNLASRIEGLTRDHAPLLVSETAYESLVDPGAYDLRRVGRFRVVGRTAPVATWEAFDEDAPDTRSAKRMSMKIHDAALAAFEAGHIADACQGFEEVARRVPDDRIAAGYLTRCRLLLEQGIPDGWDGVVIADHK